MAVQVSLHSTARLWTEANKGVPGRGVGGGSVVAIVEPQYFMLKEEGENGY